MTAPSEPPRPRTLTEALRAMSAEELATLLAARPDLLDPVPEDIAELASRSTTSASITRAVDELNGWLRTVAEALSALPDPTSVGDLEAMLGQSKMQVAAARNSFGGAVCSGAGTTCCTWYGRFARPSSPIPAASLPRRPARCRTNRSMRHRKRAAPRPAPYSNDCSGRRPAPYATPTGP